MEHAERRRVESGEHIASRQPGRTTETTDPIGNATYTVYNDSFDAGTGFVDEVRVYPGWHLDTSTGLYTTTGPVQVMRTNRTYSYTESLTYTAPQLSSSTPDGTDSISASNIQSLSRSIMNDAGQVIESDDYFSLAGITYSATSVHLGSPSDVSTSGNYSATTYSYDFHGLQDKVVSPNGTITRTIYDGQNRVISKWVGTNDTPATGYWSPSNNTSPSNMVMVEQDAYDTQSAPEAPALGSTTGGSLPSRTDYVKISYIINGVETAAASITLFGNATTHPYNVYVSTTSGQEGLQTRTPVQAGCDWTMAVKNLGPSVTPLLSGIGDSNLTQVTQFPGGGQAPRSSEMFFDWRDREVSSESGIVAGDSTPRSLSFSHYDNLGEAIEQDTYDSTGLDPAALGYDAYGVPSAPSSSLLRSKSTSSYDDQGRVFQSSVYSVDPTAGTVGSAITSNTFYDHDGNVLAVFTPGQPTSKSVYDGANRVTTSNTTDGGAVNNSGSPLLTWSAAGSVANDVVVSETDVTYDSASNAILTTTKDRLATASTTSTGALTSSNARISYVADYYDAANRSIAEVNVGTNGGSAYTRPSTVPSRSDTVLVNSMTFNDAGEPDTTTDPRGIVAKTTYDLLGRTTETIAAYTDGTPTNDTNQTTAYTYDGDDNVLTMTAVMPSGTPSQTTAYIYGVGVSGGLFSNDLIAGVEYPDPTTGYASSNPGNDVSYAYDNVGELIVKLDQNGTTHNYNYDSLGRIALDSVSTLASSVDGSVLALGYSYTPLGLPYQQSSYSDAAGTTVVNQVQDVYNGLQQLVGQYQEHSGAVNTSTTLATQYGYSSLSSGSLPTEMIYPNGRALHYGYDNAALDTAIGRVDYLADDNGSGGAGSHLVDYSYLGLSAILGQADGNGVTLTTTLDNLSRIAEMNYVNTATSTSTDDFQYGYDRNGNVLYKNNLLDSSFSELYHANSASTGDNNTAYDPLNRLTGFSRGTLTSSGNNGSGLDTVASADLNTGTGSSQFWSLDTIGNQSAVTTDGTTTGRTANSQNELTGVGSSTLAYDNNGNTTTDENGNTLKYDAWNRLVSETDPSSTVLAAYAYDANGWRITETHGSDTSDIYFSSQGQIIEERGGIGTVTNQHVWNIDYVNDLLLRDDASTSGNLGISGSGLGHRLYAQHDANYNVTAIANSSGTVEERFIYTPYGVQQALDAGWSAISGWAEASDAYHWLVYFQGGRQDDATSLVRFDRRDDSPSLGIWIERDPLGNINGSDGYQFELSNPADGLDPSGLAEVDSATDALLQFVYGDGRPAHIGGDLIDQIKDLPTYKAKTYDIQTRIAKLLPREAGRPKVPVTFSEEVTIPPVSETGGFKWDLILGTGTLHLTVTVHATVWSTGTKGDACWTSESTIVNEWRLQKEYTFTNWRNIPSFIMFSSIMDGRPYKLTGYWEDMVRGPYAHYKNFKWVGGWVSAWQGK